MSPKHHENQFATCPQASQRARAGLWGCHTAFFCAVSSRLFGRSPVPLDQRDRFSIPAVAHVSWAAAWALSWKQCRLFGQSRCHVSCTGLS